MTGPRKPTFTAEQREVVDEYHYFLEESRKNGWTTKCQTNPDSYSNYTISPDKATAEALCEGCPMKKWPCKQYAEITKPKWGLYGGVAWADGKPFVSVDDLAVRRTTPEEQLAERLVGQAAA